MKEEERIETEDRELFEHFRIEVDPGQKPLRIDKFLVNRLENASRSKIQSAADADNILVNNNAVKSNYKVKPKDSISIVMAYPPREIELISEDIPVNIVYEDDQFVIVNKEAGMVVHPSYGHYNGTLVNAMMHHLKDLPLFNSGEMRPGLVHRIDKNTTGLLVIAKTELALNRLAKQFFEKTSERKYTAIVWGTFEEKEGTITGHIGRNIKNRKIMQVFPDGDQGKHAVTHYKVLEELGYVTVVECQLETGRTHQIRAHFQHIGHPLFNDPEYGGNYILKGTTFTKYKQFVLNCFSILPRQALHAKTLGVKHPTSGEFMRFNSEIPNDMTEVMERWRRYLSGRESNQ
jgi:23S rRNA pseudouridine1911/1915/1917 synthase